MTAPTASPSPMFWPGFLMVAPALVAAASLALTGAIEPWALVAAGGLPVFGAFWAVTLCHRDVEAVGAYIRQITDAPNAPTKVAIEPEPQGGGDIAHDLMAAIARLNRVGFARTQQATERLATTQAILEALPDPLILVGAERRVHHANQAARALFGGGMDDADLTLRLRHPDVVGAVDAVLGGGGARTVEFALTGPVECVYQARVKPFGGPVAAPVGDDRFGARLALLSLHDITMVKRSEQLRADFVANASHELRTPLATLIGFIETLRGPAREDQEARDRFLGIMHDQSSRMARLVDDLLSLSRIELDEHTRPIEHVDIVRCVGAAVAAFELKAAARRVRLRVTASDPLPMVLGDPDQLAQVLQNLISNAIKYTKEQSEVSVAVTVVAQDASATAAAGIAVSAGGARRTPHSAAPLVAIAITDQGEGIARTHLPRLTERFYRVDPARSRALGGTGLGLAIVKHIVNRHRGRLIIESDVGHGTTFTVWLPTVS